MKPLIACGTCIHFSLWQRFPAVDSWVIIFPIWFVVLSGFRTFLWIPLLAIPRLYLAVPLVLAVAFFAPGTLGPYLGIWIPVCCVIGTISGIRKSPNSQVRTSIATVTILALASLISFAWYNYNLQSKMSSEERAKYLPVWEIVK